MKIRVHWNRRFVAILVCAAVTWSGVYSSAQAGSDSSSKYLREAKDAIDTLQAWYNDEHRAVQLDRMVEQRECHYSPDKLLDSFQDPAVCARACEYALSRSKEERRVY